MAEPENEVLDVAAAAAFLGLSAETIREYAKAGTITAKEVDQEWQFAKADLLAWVRDKSGHKEALLRGRPGPRD